MAICHKIQQEFIKADANLYKYMEKKQDFRFIDTTIFTNLIKKQKSHFFVYLFYLIPV